VGCCTTKVTRIQDPPNVLPFEQNNPPPKKDLRRAAEEFIAENPRIYELFRRFALEMLNRHRPFGAKFLAERVRWEVMMHWEPDERGFKINNNHTAYIARRLVEEIPALEPLLRFRKTFW
jgi:hypothetical protein